MFNISNNGIITINRGDTFTLNVFVNLGTSLEPIQYYLQPEDKLYFALMEPNQPFEDALIRKVATSADMLENGLVKITFSAEMTEYLLPGVYYYTVKLTRPEESSGQEVSQLVDTIIGKTRFNILD